MNTEACKLWYNLHGRKKEILNEEPFSVKSAKSKLLFPTTRTTWQILSQPYIAYPTQLARTPNIIYKTTHLRIIVAEIA